jgi:hypothetical protein
VALASLDDDEAGGRVRMVGPLGIGRVAQTRVIAAEPSSRLRGTADLGGGTRAAVSWDIEPAGGGSRVTLTARVERSSALDRLLLTIGGRWWLERMFRSALLKLGTAAATVRVARSVPGSRI